MEKWSSKHTKVSVIQVKLSSGDLLYNVVPIVNNSLLYILKAANKVNAMLCFYYKIIIKQRGRGNFEKKDIFMALIAVMLSWIYSFPRSSGKYIKYAHKFTYIYTSMAGFPGGSVVMNLSAM